MQENYLDVAANVAFNYLTKTNRMLIVNDKNDSFFDTFFLVQRYLFTRIIHLFFALCNRDVYVFWHILRFRTAVF